MTTADHSSPRHATAPDGTEIAYWTAGTGPPLLLVHGSMSDHRRWRITEFLAAHRTVHAMDRRGRGGSGDPPAWSTEREVEDVVAVIDVLARQTAQPVEVLGHSLGGYLALRAAARHAQVRRLVLYEPAIAESPQPAELVSRMQAQVDAGDYDGVVELMLREVLHMPDPEVAMLRQQPSWPARVATAPTLPRELSARLTVTDAEVAAVAAPTLLIHGGDSPESLRSATRSAASSLAAARLVTLAGHQHVADQTDPEMFAGVVLDFLLDGDV